MGLSHKPAHELSRGRRWLWLQRNGDKLIMPYKQRLNPWMLVRLLGKMQQITIAYYRTRSDADGHLQALRRLMPDGKFMVIFNPGLSPEYQPNSR